MNWEALLVIGSFTILAGLLLYVPGRWWAKRQIKNAPDGSVGKARVTRAGYLFFGIMIGLLFLGFAQAHIAPSSRLGEFVSTRMGRLVLFGGIVAASFVIEKILGRAGIELVWHETD